MIFGDEDDDWPFQGEADMPKPAVNSVPAGPAPMPFDPNKAYDMLWEAHGQFIFASREDLHKWLLLRHEAIENRKPSELLFNEEGVQQVNRLLGRLEYGIMA